MKLNKIIINTVLIFTLLCSTAVAYQPEYKGTYYQKADGTPMDLINNDDAKRPTYEQVIKFLEKDNTDEHPSDPSSYDCVDFAEELHNNAEAAGLKCGVVDVNLVEEDIDGVVYRSGHECNVFKLKERSLLFVDCVYGDCISHAEEGDVYSIRSIYTGEVSYFEGFEDVEVRDVRIFW